MYPSFFLPSRCVPSLSFFLLDIISKFSVLYVAPHVTCIRDLDNTQTHTKRRLFFFSPSDNLNQLTTHITKPFFLFSFSFLMMIGDDHFVSVLGTMLMTSSMQGQWIMKVGHSGQFSGGFELFPNSPAFIHEDYTLYWRPILAITRLYTLSLTSSPTRKLCTLFMTRAGHHKSFNLVNGISILPGGHYWSLGGVVVLASQIWKGEYKESNRKEILGKSGILGFRIPYLDPVGISRSGRPFSRFLGIPYSYNYRRVSGYSRRQRPISSLQHSDAILPQVLAAKQTKRGGGCAPRSQGHILVNLKALFRDMNKILPLGGVVPAPGLLQPIHSGQQSHFSGDQSTEDQSSKPTGNGVLPHWIREAKAPEPFGVLLQRYHSWQDQVAKKVWLQRTYISSILPLQIVLKSPLEKISSKTIRTPYIGECKSENFLKVMQLQFKMHQPSNMYLADQTDSGMWGGNMYWLNTPPIFFHLAGLGFAPKMQPLEGITLASISVL
ncbi:putative signal peptide protein [Puccinia sorghi]|uniref:Putative signal peptide protein n=1 Tax=Puccinia sorghi TaxID=27349 RepID=A0A0L6U633_9BASI|nr:putative signal peptide protein [Puccinia sorghi]